MLFQFPAVAAPKFYIFFLRYFPTAGNDFYTQLRICGICDIFFLNGGVNNDFGFASLFAMQQD